MTKLNERQIQVLRSAPIGMDVDHGNGDPHRSPRFIYHGVDGRVAAGLWHRKLLNYSPIGYGAEGGMLVLTPAGRHALSQTDRGGERG